MKKIKFKVSNFSLNNTIKTEQCPADLWYFDNFSGYWISYIPVKGKWCKIMMKQKENEIEVCYTSEHKEEEILAILTYIFRLDYNLEDLYSHYLEDKYLQKVFNKCKGLRVMRDLSKEYRILEAVLTQNTSIKMIKRMQRLLFINYGEKVKINGEEIHIYPTAEKIASIDVNELKKKCKLGYRASYLKQLAKDLIQGKLSIKKIEILSSKDARKYLMEFKGIGKKVADIILMYGFGRRDVFPLDLWVKKAIKREYFDNKNASEREIHEFATEYFGEHASLINLMIFNYERGKEEFHNLCVWK